MFARMPSFVGMLEAMPKGQVIFGSLAVVFGLTAVPYGAQAAGGKIPGLPLSLPIIYFLLITLFPSLPPLLIFLQREPFLTPF